MTWDLPPPPDEARVVARELAREGFSLVWARSRRESRDHGGRYRVCWAGSRMALYATDNLDNVRAWVRSARA